MDSKTKQQVFDVLNEGGMIGEGEIFEAYMKYISDLEILVTVPDNIESLMLDWLEEQKWCTYSLQKITQDEGRIVLTYCDLDKYLARTKVTFTLVDGKYTDKDVGKYHKVNEIFYNIKLNKPRQVALAEACSWVYKEQDKQQESK